MYTEVCTQLVQHVHWQKIASPLCTVMMYFWYGPSEQPRVVIILKASMDKPQET